MPYATAGSSHPVLGNTTRPAVGPWRRKVTIACDACRKRRIKCSGSCPCNLCVENGRVCAFDEKNRGRRGPRRRPPVPKVNRDIAPAPPASSGATESVAHDQQTTALPTEPAETAEPAEAAHSGDVFRPVEPARTAESVDTMESGDSDEEEPGSGMLPDFSTWKASLAVVLFGAVGTSSGCGSDAEANCRGSQDVGDLELVGHLLQLLWCRQTLLLRQLLPEGELAEQLRLGRCPRGLIYAICACTARFSVHRAKGGSSAAGLGDKFERLARQEVADRTGVRGSNWSLIQTYCVLAEYSASKGNGGCAWIDIGIARSLLEVTVAMGHPEDLASPVLPAADHFLAVKELCFCLGQPSLERMPSRRWEAVAMPRRPGDDSQQFLRLLTLLVRIQRFGQTSLLASDPLPWKPSSAFQDVQNELRAHLIQRPETIHLLDVGRTARCALAWHCCQILLSRVFLPIPERRRGSTSTGDTPGVAGGGDATVRSVQFPGAPPLFLYENMHSCESSAAAICTICREVVASGQFFLLAPWVGYSCFQSAVVLVNQLHRSTRPHDETVVESLKFAFTMLRLVANFYAPAHAWTECLFRVHDTVTPLRHQTDTLDAAFSTYFGRFVGVKEPSFVTLEPTETAPCQDGGTGQQTGLQNAPGLSDGNRQRGDEGISSQSPDEAWLQSYASHLAEDISDDEGSHDVGNRPPGVATPLGSRYGPEPIIVDAGDGVHVQAHNGEALLEAVPGLGGNNNSSTGSNSGLSGNGLWNGGLMGHHLALSPGLFTPFAVADGPDDPLWSAMMEQIVAADGDGMFWAGSPGAC